MLAAERDAKVQHLFHAGFPQLHIILPLLNLKNRVGSELFQFVFRSVFNRLQLDQNARQLPLFRKQT